MQSITSYNFRHKLWVSFLLIGFIAILCAHLFIVPNKFGINNTLNTSFVWEIFNKRTTSDNSNNTIQNKNHKPLKFRINKHFQTEKLVFILLLSTRFSCFNTTLPKPLYYYSNHFVSSFLYICKGRAPPVIA
ncbi:hypothetical protein A9P82_13795 [Arachidicoccus ginsenosidimutans]|nr:hypothetical protein A9P82_13795 [Arachidicoccus sp. BS20]